MDANLVFSPMAQLSAGVCARARSSGDMARGLEVGDQGAEENRILIIQARL
jgi:hypothetical protein